LKSYRKCIQNNNEKLELLYSFQKLIFGQRSAAPLKVPPGARGPQGLPLATPLIVQVVCYTFHTHMW